MLFENGVFLVCNTKNNEHALTLVYISVIHFPDLVTLSKSDNYRRMKAAEIIESRTLG